MEENIKLKRMCLSGLILLIFTSCSMDFFISSAKEIVIEKEPEEIEEEEIEEIEEVEEPVSTIPIEEMPEENRLWSFLVYMSADNNLEASAIEDMLEMESSNLNTGAVSVFVLMDRSPSYDTSDSNWSGTRLFKLTTGRAENSKNLISEEIECSDLNLSPGVSVELDMSSSYVLEGVLNFIMEKYPAENYGLIMWGHGTGWRNENSDAEIFSDKAAGYKGFAFDETSGTYMTLKQLREGLERGLGGEKLAFLGFDTCFGATFEVMYELKDCCEYAAGAEGLLMSSGWNYKLLFNAFNNSVSYTGEDFGNILLNQFQSWYESSNGASFSLVKMDSMSDFFLAFDQMMLSFADNIQTRTTRDEVMGLIYSNTNSKTEKYTYGSENSDVYIDVNSIAEVLEEAFSTNEEICTCISEYRKKKDEAIIGSWHSNGTEGSLSIYFSTLKTGSLLSVSHPANYVRGKTVDQIAFVSESQGYVPDVQNNDSFLGKLFYKAF